MPLSDEVKEELGSADPDEVADALKEANSKAHGAIFRQGYGKAKGELESELQEQQEKVNTLQQEREQLSSQVEQLEQEQPDLEEFQRQKEQALKEKEQKWESKYNELQEKLRSGKKETNLQKLQSKLTEKLGNEWLAKQLVRSDGQDRIEIAEDGDERIYQDDGQTPYPVNSTEEALDRLAEDMSENVPSGLLNQSQNGTGYRGGKGGNSSTSNFDPKTASPSEVSKFVSEHGMEAFNERLSN